jgi:hypothetical protein
MEITLEKIDLLRKRADVSYQEAKQALEENDGNVVEALAYLEEKERIRPEKESCGRSFWNNTKSVYRKSSSIRFVISRDGQVLLNVGVPLALLVSVIAMPLAVTLLVLALLTGCKIRFVGTKEDETGISDSLNKAASKAEDLAEKLVSEIKDA